MTVTLALAGDTMLGRGVARALATTPPEALVAPEVRAALDEADLVVLNLECCISERGRPWEAPGKPFFFRARPGRWSCWFCSGLTASPSPTTMPWTTASTPGRHPGPPDRSRHRRRRSSMRWAS
jgi:Bacterial capsule synthesis protein PGA_cap